MRILTTIISLALTVLLSSCDQQNSTSDVDPNLGLECFENHRASLPPGTQYEGIEKVDENVLTIRIMNGVEVVTLDCGLNGLALAGDKVRSHSQSSQPDTAQQAQQSQQANTAGSGEEALMRFINTPWHGDLDGMLV